MRTCNGVPIRQQRVTAKKCERCGRWLRSKYKFQLHKKACDRCIFPIQCTNCGETYLFKEGHICKKSKIRKTSDPERGKNVASSEEEDEEEDEESSEEEDEESSEEEDEESSEEEDEESSEEEEEEEESEEEEEEPEEEEEEKESSEEEEVEEEEELPSTSSSAAAAEQGIRRVIFKVCEKCGDDICSKDYESHVSSKCRGIPRKNKKSYVRSTHIELS